MKELIVIFNGEKHHYSTNNADCIKQPNDPETKKYPTYATNITPCPNGSVLVTTEDYKMLTYYKVEYFFIEHPKGEN